MQPLLSIRTVPIQLEYQITRATLRYNSTMPSVNITRNRGRQSIQMQPAKVQIDSYETRASMGLKTVRRSIEEHAANGRQAAQEATRAYAENGNRIVDSHGKGSPAADIAREKTTSTTQTVLSFLPSVRPEISATSATIAFDYTMDELIFDWNTRSRLDMEYIPGETVFQITQYPEVVIEYLGPPIYVPPSADPDYQPLDSTG